MSTYAQKVEEEEPPQIKGHIWNNALDKGGGGGGNKLSLLWVVQYVW